MGDSESTIRSRELGDALRSAMERANLNGKLAARLLDWSESRMSRLLSGKLGVDQLDLASFLAICGVTGEERGRLLALNREGVRPGWLQQYGASLPEQLTTLVNHEIQAVEIHEFEPLRIPGLLQTADYARALLERSPLVSAEEIALRVSARTGRQGLFNRDYRPEFTFFLHEFALCLPVGGDSVMSEQLHHLLMMGVRSCINIRVIPVAFGAYAAMAGAWRLMDFAEFKPVVYVEEDTAGHFLEEPVEIAAYRKMLDSLASCALDEGQSRDLIAALAVELYADREDRDDRD